LKARNTGAIERGDGDLDAAGSAAGTIERQRPAEEKMEETGDGALDG
jgi:hypothetical protein